MRTSKSFHLGMAVMLIALCTLLLGCPRKTPPPEGKPPAPPATTGPRITPAKPAEEPLSPLAGQREAETEAARIAAIKGEDLPLAPMKEKPAFTEPATTGGGAVFKPVYFDYDKSDIKPEYRTILDSVAQWLKSNPKRMLLVEGHCDERGTNEYNLALGERRALSVRRYLVGLGVHPEVIQTISYGEEKPADPGHDEEAWAKNRRAEFKISAAE